VHPVTPRSNLMIKSTSYQSVEEGETSVYYARASASTSPTSSSTASPSKRKSTIVGILCPFISSFESNEDRRRRWLEEDDEELARAEAVPVEVVDVIDDSNKSIVQQIVSPDLTISMNDFTQRPVESVLKVIKIIVIAAFLGGCASLFV